MKDAKELYLYYFGLLYTKYNPKYYGSVKTKEELNKYLDELEAVLSDIIVSNKIINCFVEDDNNDYVSQLSKMINLIRNKIKIQRVTLGQITKEEFPLYEKMSDFVKGFDEAGNINYELMFNGLLDETIWDILIDFE